ncbi:hypothetical protein [Candidatus Ruthturnera calyptogenae]|nr:hypothetical protein [Candidatus Ruthturnera calyptogenae]
MALMIAQPIINYLSEIFNDYKTHQSKFLERKQYVSTILLNTLVSDVTGLSKKFKNRANNYRTEYVISDNSMNAIKVILATQAQVINSSDYQDFSDITCQLKARK